MGQHGDLFVFLFFFLMEGKICVASLEKHCLNVDMPPLDFDFSNCVDVIPLRTCFSI